MLKGVAKTSRRARAVCASAIIFAVVGLAGCDDYLEAADVETLLSGNTVRGTSGDGRAYFVYFAPDGANLMQTADGFVDEGRWRVTSEGRYCGKWSKVRAGEERCFDVRKGGEEELTFERGDEVHQLRLIKGRASQIGE